MLLFTYVYINGSSKYILVRKHKFVTQVFVTSWNVSNIFVWVAQQMCHACYLPYEDRHANIIRERVNVVLCGIRLRPQDLLGAVEEIATTQVLLIL